MNTPLFGEDGNGGICSTMECMNKVGSVFDLTSAGADADGNIAVMLGGGGNDEDTIGGGGNGIPDVDFETAGMAALLRRPLFVPSPLE